MNILEEKYRKDVSVYFAGKITKNGWREGLFSHLSSYPPLGRQPEAPLFPVPVFIDEMNTNQIDISIFYNGPWFIGCDHGCYHGPESHGRGASYQDVTFKDDEQECMPDIGYNKRVEILNLCRKWILNSDYFFAWIDDFTAYGTLVEIGFAHRSFKPIYIFFANSKLQQEMWLATSMASFSAVVDSVSTAYSEFKNRMIEHILDEYFEGVVK